MLEQIAEARVGSSAVPKPANWRIVHNRPRYMLGYTPRVNGNSPGPADLLLELAHILGPVERTDRLPRQRRDWPNRHQLGTVA